MKYNIYWVRLGNFHKLKTMKLDTDGKPKFGKYQCKNIDEVIMAFGIHVDAMAQHYRNSRLRFRRMPAQMACFAGETLVAVSNGSTITEIDLEDYSG